MHMIVKIDLSTWHFMRDMQRMGCLLWADWAPERPQMFHSAI